MKSVFFKNIRTFKLSSNLPECLTTDRDEFEQMLEDRAHAPVGQLESRSIGWTTANDVTDLFAHWVEDVCLLRLRVESKVIPAAAVKKALEERCRQVERQQGFRPGRKQTKEIKYNVIDELSAKALTTYRHTQVLIDVANKLLLVDASSSTRCDEVLGLLVRTVDPFPVESVQVVRSPATVMTNWLLADEADPPFVIEQEIKFVNPSQSKAAVAYKDVSVDPEDVKTHVQTGRQCVRLGLTYNDRLSFVLTDDLTIKSVKPLDVLREYRGADLNALEAF